MEKQDKRINLGSGFSVDDFTGNIEEVISALIEIRDENKQYSRIEIENDLYSDDDYIGGEYNFIGYRPETEEEYAARLDMKAKEELRVYLQKQEKERKEKETYLQLKAKYENQS